MKKACPLRMELFASFPKKLSKKDDFDALKARLETYLSELLLLEVLDECKCLRDWLELDTLYKPVDSNDSRRVQWFSGLELVEEIRANTEAQLNAAVAVQEGKIKEWTARVQKLSSQSDLTLAREWARSSRSKGEEHEEVISLVRQIEDGELELAQLKHNLFEWYGFTADYLETTISAEALRLMDKVEHSSLHAPLANMLPADQEDAESHTSPRGDQPQASPRGGATLMPGDGAPAKKKKPRVSLLPWRSSRRQSETDDSSNPSSPRQQQQQQHEQQHHEPAASTSPRQQLQQAPPQAEATEEPVRPASPTPPTAADSSVPTIACEDPTGMRGGGGSSNSDSSDQNVEFLVTPTRKATLTISRTDSSAGRQARVRRVMRFSVMLREQQEAIKLRTGHKSGVPE